MQDPLLAVDENPDGIGVDLQTTDEDAARRGGHYALFFDLEGAVVDDGQAMVNRPGNAIELQINRNRGGGVPVGPNNSGSIEAHGEGEKGVFAFLRGGGDDKNRLGILKLSRQGAGSRGGRGGRGIGFRLGGGACERQTEQERCEEQRVPTEHKR